MIMNKVFVLKYEIKGARNIARQYLCEVFGDCKRAHAYADKLRHVDRVENIQIQATRFNCEG